MVIEKDINAPDPALDTGGQDEPELSLREELEANFESAELDDQAVAQPGMTQRERDELGRFTAKQQQEEAKQQELPAIPAAPGPKGQPQPGVAAPAAPDLKAPGSWRPEVREKWGKLDPEVRAEVVRREREFQQVLQTGAQQRQFVDAFERVVSPYQLFIRAENSSPLQAVDNLMATAAMLRTGNQTQRVQVVGSIIQQWLAQHGDLEALDNYLAGRLGQQPQMPQQQQFHDPRVDAMLAQQQQQQQRAAQQEDAELNQGIEQFAGEHEFFNDVRVTMGDLIEMAGQRGQVLPMEEAYRRACQLDPDVSKILSQRENAANTGRLSQAALRAKRAARSVTGDSTPDGNSVPKDDSVRAALEAAFEAHSGR